MIGAADALPAIVRRIAAERVANCRAARCFPRINFMSESAFALTSLTVGGSSSPRRFVINNQSFIVCAHIPSNRENAKRSTGPKSLAGRLKSSRNALRHGLSIPAADGPPSGTQAYRLAELLTPKGAGQLETLAGIHADDTTVPVLAKLKTVTGRIWTYVRDDRPFGGTDPPGALFYYSRNRTGEHPRSHLAGYVGLMQADAFDGYNQLYKAQRKPAPILEAACWSHGRRKFFDLAKSGEAPIASEAVRRIDILFEIERAINGKTPEQRLAVRREKSAPIVADLEIWMRKQRTLLSSGNDTAKAINYLLNGWAAFTRFLDDGRVCLSNNAAERALRGAAIGRRNWTFAGSDAGGNRAAAVYTLIETCKMNDVDPQAWLADVLARLPDYPINRVADLLPWIWKADRSGCRLSATADWRAWPGCWPDAYAGSAIPV